LWELKLKPGLKFATGQPITMTDVAATYERVRNLPKSTYAGIFAGITEFKIIDDQTLHVVTSNPYPILPTALTQLVIVPAEIAKTATPADFATAKANVSSAAYKFVEFLPGNRLVLERNEDYTGPKAKWDKVTFRFLPNGAARVAALLAGDVDVIDDVPPSEVSTLKKSGKASVFVGESDAVNFFSMDLGRDVTPFLTDHSGNQLKSNPFKDIRVRRALTLAVDRNLIRDRVMEGLSYPNSQIVPRQLGGYASGIPDIVPDMNRARALMKETGWGDGFAMTMHCPEGRYPNAAQICQAGAQMLARLNIKATVEMLPRSVFFSRMTDRSGPRGSFILFGWGASSAGEANVLQQVIHTYDREKRLGTWNLAHYSNPEIDRVIQDALNIVDAPKRHAMQARAVTMAMDDAAVIPLHTQSVVLASRKDLKIEVYSNFYTLADAVTPSDEK
jgi:peptide/nickel transport system substrate-binding protein